MAKAAGHCDVAMLGTEQFAEEFDRLRAFNGTMQAPAPLPFSTMAGTIMRVEYQAPTWVTLRKYGRKVRTTGSGCHAFLNHEEVDSTGLRNKAFERLDALVKRAGGPTALGNSAKDPFDLGAIIQSESSTPWKCIASAIYNLQIAGYPTVDLVVL